MKRTSFLGAARAVFGAALLMNAGFALAAEEPPEPENIPWSFDGPLGKFDRAQLQRGLLVYKSVCANCHSMNLVANRNLADPGGPEYSPEQVKAFAAEQKFASLDENGAPAERSGRPDDYFPSPYKNDAEARAANGGALPPDLSVIAKAREHGVDYLNALLVGYKDPPEGVQGPEGKYYNVYYPGNFIGMPAPLGDDVVPYTDGTPPKLDQYAKDVSAFLMWTAEPKLEERNRIGLQVMAFLVVFAGLLYYTTKKVWTGVEH